jgi:FtsH-binding integral membrane protein
MSYDFNQQMPMPLSEAEKSRTFIAAMQKVYMWMALGLLTTAVAALAVVNIPALSNIIFSNILVFYCLLIGEVVLVIAIGRVVTKVSDSKGLALFFLYSAINGLTLSVIFGIYDINSIWLAFGTTAVLFGIMSVVGYTTQQDLSKWGGILFMGLIGIIVASSANMFLANSTLDWIITYGGILLFLALTVYDTNRIKQMTYTALANGQTDVVGQVGVLGALRLYLDFINLFLFILRLFGGRRR